MQTTTTVEVWVPSWRECPAGWFAVSLPGAWETGTSRLTEQNSARPTGPGAVAVHASYGVAAPHGTWLLRNGASSAHRVTFTVHAPVPVTVVPQLTCVTVLDPADSP